MEIILGVGQQKLHLLRLPLDYGFILWVNNLAFIEEGNRLRSINSSSCNNKLDRKLREFLCFVSADGMVGHGSGLMEHFPRLLKLTSLLH